MAFRKRVYGGSGASRRPMKRSKPSYYRKRRYRSRPNYAASSGTRPNVSLGFRSRKLRPKRFRSELFRSSLNTPHYRSAFVTGANVTSPVSVSQMTTAINDMINPNFWQSSNGAQPPIGGGTIFANKFVIRGGLCRFTACNASTTANVRLRVWKIITLTDGSFPPAATVSSMYDPSMDQNFRDNFKILAAYDCMLGPLESVEYFHRLKTRLWDPVQQTVQKSFVPFWYIGVCGLDGGANTVTISNGHNLSFTGDLVTL